MPTPVYLQAALLLEVSASSFATSAYFLYAGGVALLKSSHWGALSDGEHEVEYLNCGAVSLSDLYPDDRFFNTRCIAPQKQRAA